MVVIWVTPAELATFSAVVAGALFAAEDPPPNPNDKDAPAVELDGFVAVAAPPLDGCSEKLAVVVPAGVEEGFVSPKENPPVDAAAGVVAAAVVPAAAEDDAPPNENPPDEAVGVVTGVVTAAAAAAEDEAPPKENPPVDAVVPVVGAAVAAEEEEAPPKENPEEDGAG